MAQIKLFGYSTSPFVRKVEVLYAMDRQMVEPLWPTIVEGVVTVDHTLKSPPEGKHETVIWTN
ncbi:MAG TPA: hypothetical protein EYG52_06320 [Pseudomonadales bacterium]|nr:hypothetical protein [Pseudomonadales bacterium]